LLLTLNSCAAELSDQGADGEQAASDIASLDQPIIYGEDDRRDVYDQPESNLREIARTSIVALIPKARLQRPATGELLLNATPLGTAYHLCKGERFYEQPTAADCTGVLIDSDLIVTAGHCVQEAKCSDYHFVFDYFYRAPGQLEPISANDVFACRQLVAHETSRRNGREIDYALIQLDRPAIGRTPLKIRRSAANDDEALSVLGSGSGLPIKIDSGARVITARAAERDYFEIEADTFEGSSGSAIVDREGALLGILVRGGPDYVENADGGCNVVNRAPRALTGTLPSGDPAHEEASYATSAVDALCRLGFPSAALCMQSGRCGDDVCSASETRASCPNDCDPCKAGACGARADMRAGPSASVKQSPGSGRSGASASCSLSHQPSGARAQFSLSTLLACALFVARRRRTSRRAP
jgi:V8-like Glu-specific endopeptidase